MEQALKLVDVVECGDFQSGEPYGNKQPTTGFERAAVLPGEDYKYKYM